MPKTMSKLLIKQLKKACRGCVLKLVTKNTDIQTISVDGKEIAMMWRPHIDTFSNEAILDILVEDCINAIKDLRQKSA